MNLDFGFFNLQIVQSFILKGLAFSVQLTLFAMVGGIALGTVLALMRLSGKPWLVMPAAAYVNVLRSIPLVMVILWFFLLIPLLLGRPLGAEVSAIGAYDLLKGFEVAGKNFNRPVETYLAAAVVYFVICFSLSMTVRQLQKKIAIIR